jgi:two-component system nitrogen regulation response regulator GlnG
VQTNVRLIAATNRDLERMVGDGTFRNDLYYRVSVFTIRLPPLRERLEDLSLLVDHFLRRFSRELHKDVTQTSPEALEVLRRHPWPGNLRELQGVLKQAILAATGPVLLPEFLREALHTPGAAPPAPSSSVVSDEFITERIRAGSEELYAEALARMERHLLLRVLEHTGGNQLKAAKILGITRGSLRFKIRALGITIERSVEAEGDSAD